VVGCIVSSGVKVLLVRANDVDARGTRMIADEILKVFALNGEVLPTKTSGFKSAFLNCSVNALLVNPE
jgi:hypothetical protein